MPDRREEGTTVFGNVSWHVEASAVSDSVALPEVALDDVALDDVDARNDIHRHIASTREANGTRQYPGSRAATAVDFATSVSVDAAYEHCRQVARTVARTFYYGSLFLPVEKRRASWALYGFCRTADDIADEPDRYPDPAAELDHWREALVETYAGRPRGPVMVAWADILKRYPVPIAPALELLDGVAMDLTGTHYKTFEDLWLYCYRVAGTVGLLMAPVLGYQDTAALNAAVDLGIGMQLTNILRDIGEDAVAKRVYLPDEDLERFGYTREELLKGVRNDAFVRLVEFEMARAEEYYERGLRGVARLDPDAQLAIALSAQLYRAILRRIRRNNYDVFTRRAHTSLLEKLAALPGTWMRLQLTRT